MRVQFRTLSAGPTGNRHPGSVHDVSEAEGAALVKGRYAFVTTRELTPQESASGPDADEPATEDGGGGERVRLRFLTTSAGPRGVRLAGSEHLVPAAEAAELLKPHPDKTFKPFVERVADATPQVETADAPAGETADMPGTTPLKGGTPNIPPKGGTPSKRR